MTTTTEPANPLAELPADWETTWTEARIEAFLAREDVRALTTPEYSAQIKADVAACLDRRQAAIDEARRALWDQCADQVEREGYLREPETYSGVVEALQRRGLIVHPKSKTILRADDADAIRAEDLRVADWEAKQRATPAAATVVPASPSRLEEMDPRTLVEVVNDETAPAGHRIRAVFEVLRRAVETERDALAERLAAAEHRISRLEARPVGVVD